jgi:hypothetical protein
MCKLVAANANAIAIAGTLIAAMPASAQQHAHAHGRLALDVAVDAQSITVQIESPLDSFVGFERAPRTDAERKRVADMVARLNAADRLLQVQVDPRTECELSKVELESATLGLGRAKKPSEKPAGDSEHADIDITAIFACAKAADARFIDTKRLFDTFKGIRTIDAQVASAQGQSKRVLRPDSARLSWGR